MGVGVEYPALSIDGGALDHLASVTLDEEHGGARGVGGRDDYLRDGDLEGLRRGCSPGYGGWAEIAAASGGRSGCAGNGGGKYCGENGIALCEFLLAIDDEAGCAEVGD